MKHRLSFLLAASALGAISAAHAGELADAAMRGDGPAIERLLAAHADVNEPRPDGATALHWAVYRNDLTTARALVKAGANVTLANEAGVAPLLLAPSKPDPEKLSAYECGFPAFDDARMKFDVRFYLVSILFIIFDLEVAFLFPWAISLKSIGMFGFWSMVVFLGVLTVGFIYEWKKGALEWE